MLRKIKIKERWKELIRKNTALSNKRWKKMGKYRWSLSTMSWDRDKKKSKIK